MKNTLNVSFVTEGFRGEKRRKQINKPNLPFFPFVQVVEVYGLLALGMSLWNQLVVPVLFMVFWLVLFALQIYSYFSTRDQPASRERLLFLFLTR